MRIDRKRGSVISCCRSQVWVGALEKNVVPTAALILLAEEGRQLRKKEL